MSNAFAQETCGLSNVQYNQMHKDGFESAQSTAVAKTMRRAVSAAVSDPGNLKIGKDINLGKPLGYAQKIAHGVAPTITIVTPLVNANLPGRKFEVRGTFTGPINTGVIVNGSPALTYGNQWASLPMSPPAGSFTIEAIATTLDGMTANATRNITVGNAQPQIELLPKQAGSLAPASIGFQFRSASGVILGNIQVDFNGDGNVDFDGPAASIPTSFAYAAPGIYTARATAQISGNPVSSERSILIADVIVQRQRACSVYGELRTALTANNLEASLRTFAVHKREAMRPFFNALGSNRPTFATRLGTIANGLIGLEGVRLTTIRLEAGQPIGYPLDISAGADGVWRITSF